ncbi:MAG: glucose-1-phosphate adenylyltransferase, partial [Planctomycetales bacterium]
AGSEPPFNFISPEAPIYSHARYLPPSRIDGATITNSLMADGCIVEQGAVIENSVIGLRCQIGAKTVIRNSILMGADFYETPTEIAHDEAEGRPPLGIGAGATIDGAIIDKNCHIGSQVRLVNDRDVVKEDVSKHVVIRDKIIVVEKDGVIPDGWKG